MRNGITEDEIADEIADHSDGIDACTRYAVLVKVLKRYDGIRRVYMLSDHLFFNKNRHNYKTKYVCVDLAYCVFDTQEPEIIVLPSNERGEATSWDELCLIRNKPEAFEEALNAIGYAVIG